jgi:crotonobetainyl-CoA:carnitine CoA-transferase CaiB-like acyl-CoA transferase
MTDPGSDATRILEGIRVVEVATFVFGPAAGTVMGDFGAEVIHVEPPATGDPYRYLPQLKPLPECEHNYCWLLDARNKKSLAVDLKSEAGREVLLALVSGADVFITNYHPSVLADLRLRYEDLAPLNPRLVYAHATGYGEEGAEVEKPGYDATAWWARSGMMDAVRPAGVEPALATPGMGDHPSAMSVFGGIMLALYARQQTGKGTKVSSSLVANGAWANSIYVQAAMCGAPPYRHVDHVGTPNALVNHYATSDGKRFYLAMVKEAAEWPGLARAIERPELLEDPRFAALEERRRNAAALVAILDEVFASRTFAKWREALDKHRVTFGPIAASHEVPDDAQLAAAGVFREIDHPELGALKTVDSPIQLRGATKRPPGVAPEIGQHTREVLGSLGYSDARIAELAGSGAVRVHARSG